MYEQPLTPLVHPCEHGALVSLWDGCPEDHLAQFGQVRALILAAIALVPAEVQGVRDGLGLEVSERFWARDFEAAQLGDSLECRRDRARGGPDAEQNDSGVRDTRHHHTPVRSNTEQPSPIK